MKHPSMAPVTILQVVPRLDTGGSELATLEIAEALTRAGGRALVATEGGRMAKAIVQGGGEVIEMPVSSKNPLTIWRNAGRLARLIQERDVDLIHARSRAPAWSAFLAARRTGIPFVTTYHGAYGEFGPIKAFYNSVMGRGDLVIANSRYTAHLMASQRGVSQERIRTIFRGVEGAVFDPVSVPPGPVAKLRERWGISPDTKIVMQAARLTGLKGQRDTIEAAALLNREGALDGAVVIFAGDAHGKDAYREELIERIKRHRLEDKVRLVGHCADMPVAFLASHVALVPSLVAETFGRTSIEAQAMGCPVIVSSLGALPETIVSAEQSSDRFTGWLVAPANPASLADRIHTALTLSPEDRAEIGLRARAHVAANFALAQMQHKTLEVYDELLGTDLADRFLNPPSLMAGPET
ncbi:MAG TPA: glycosyltransferase family 4 protein [Methyloceanibacter sp.]|nr:glycosyltransferase family 4 protein [Methyloceanibacter sp.]